MFIYPVSSKTGFLLRVMQKQLSYKCCIVWVTLYQYGIQIIKYICLNTITLFQQNDQLRMLVAAITGSVSWRYGNRTLISTPMIRYISLANIKT